ncbi:MAG TPA: STAS domain-containing protein [Streptosporangiaceae bacterium]
MTQISTQATRERGGEIQILHAPEELDLATADSLAEHGCAAFAHAWLLLLDLGGLWFCDARGLSAFVKIANHAEMTGRRYGLIAPRPQVTKVLRICGLDQRLPVFATVDDALEHFTVLASV